MKRGQVIRDVALFPMEWLYITQGMNGGLSHRNTKAIDIVGKDRTHEWAYAPFDCTLVWKDVKSGNGLCWQSDRPVLWANGTTDFVHFTMWHMDDISAYRVGQKFKQGEKIYKEGTAGFVTGVHIDLKVAKGKYPGGYPLLKNSFNAWYLRNEVAPFDVFFINDTFIQVDKDGKKLDGGYKWELYVPAIEFDRNGTAKIKIKASVLNYRKTPNGERVGLLPSNVELVYLGKTNMINGYEWAEIVYENEIVYCALNDEWNEVVLPVKEVVKVVEKEVVKEVIKEVVKPLDETIEKNGMKVRVVIT